MEANEWGIYDCSCLLEQHMTTKQWVHTPAWDAKFSNAVSGRQAHENKNPFGNHTLSTLAMLLAMLGLSTARWLPAALTQKMAIKSNCFPVGETFAGSCVVRRILLKQKLIFNDTVHLSHCKICPWNRHFHHKFYQRQWILGTPCWNSAGWSRSKFQELQTKRRT